MDGNLLESLDKPGVANLFGDIMTRGTKNKTTAELEAAIQQLGATVNVYATTEGIRVSGNTLARNYDATMELVTEMLLEPRWDAEELETLRQRALSQIEQRAAQPNAIAGDAYNRLLYGEDNIRAYPFN